MEQLQCENVSVVERYHCKVDKMYFPSEFMMPSTLASVTCAIQVAQWADNTGNGRDDIIYVIEHADEGQSNLRNKWK